MDFIERVRNLGERVQRQSQRAQRSEEATKTALVQPFIRLVLGYDINDLNEVDPEYTADMGTKKGEKVDYAILKAGKPIMLFECKRCGSDLDREEPSQLYRYFSVTDARFGVLTNGVIYRFFADLEEPNKMDAKPFLEINLLDIQEPLVNELKKFTKETFDLGEILTTANDLKYTREIKRFLSDQWTSPSYDFTRFFASRVLSGRRKLTKARMEQFGEITKRAFQQFVRDRITDRFKSALEREEVPQPPAGETPEVEGEEEEDKRIVTTLEETQAYYIVQAILSEVVEPKRVVIRDHITHCNILLDDNLRKPLCRLHFNFPQKRLGLFDEQRREERVPIDDLNDIFKYRDRLKVTMSYYDKQ